MAESEAICTVLQIAPSTYYAAMARTPSDRDDRNARLPGEMAVSLKKLRCLRCTERDEGAQREGIRVADARVRLMRR